MAEYKAKLDFHHNGAHYPVGKKYEGKDAEKLLEAGLIEEGKGHDKAGKYTSMRVKTHVGKRSE